MTMQTGSKTARFRLIHGLVAAIVALLIFNQYRLWKRLQAAKLIVRGYWEAIRDA